MAVAARINGSDGNPNGQPDALFLAELGPRAAIFLSRGSISNVIGATWTGVASLALSATYENLKLTNLNFVNDETFFNFSCYEKASDQRGSQPLLAVTPLKLF